MKKKNLLLFLLSLILSLSGCTTSRERQFFRFLNSRRIDLTMSIRAEAQGVETTLDFVDIIVYKEFLSISFPTSEKSIIVDSKEGKNYYDSETSGKIMTTFEKEEKPNNMSYVIFFCQLLIVFVFCSHSHLSLNIVPSFIFVL